MKNIVLIFSLILLVSFNATSQDEQLNIEAINSYKYIIVPLEYDLLDDKDKYQINSLTKFLFNKYGYTAFLENDPLPKDLRLNKCLALKADLVKAKGQFLNTKVKINLIDCNDEVVITSKVGKTREKEYKIAYNLALRDAFESFQFFNYKYKPNAVIVASLSSDDDAAQKEIQRLKQEVATLKEEKEVKQNVVMGVVETSSNENEDDKNEIVAKIETSPKKNDVEQNVIVGVIETPSKKLKENIEILYAQPIDGGFQVVNQTTKVVMVLLQTPKADMFMVKGQNAMVYKEGGLWYISKNDGKSTSIEPLNLKF